MWRKHSQQKTATHRTVRFCSGKHREGELNRSGLLYSSVLGAYNTGCSSGAVAEYLSLCHAWRSLKPFLNIRVLTAEAGREEIQERSASRVRDASLASITLMTHCWGTAAPWEKWWMDDRNKGGGGGETQFRKPEHRCSINAFWQVLPFGESKGSCGPGNKKGVKKKKEKKIRFTFWRESICQVQADMQKVWSKRGSPPPPPPYFHMIPRSVYNKNSSSIQCWYCTTEKINRTDVKTDLSPPVSLSCVTLAQRICFFVEIFFFPQKYQIKFCTAVPTHTHTHTHCNAATQMTSATHDVCAAAVQAAKGTTGLFSREAVNPFTFMWQPDVKCNSFHIKWL